MKNAGTTSGLAAAIGLILSGCSPPDTKLQRNEVDLISVGLAFKQYAQEAKSLPSDEEGFTPLAHKGLLRNWPVDPWGERYEYKRISHDANGATICYGGRTKMIFSFFESKSNTGTSKP